MVKVEIIYYTENGEELVALASKRSLSKKPAKEIKLSSEEVRKWVLETFRRQYWSPWEFSWYVFEVECSRVCTHQLVRHRIASYAQLSQRKGMNLIKLALNSITKFVSLPCKEGDYMCYALAVDRFSKMLRGCGNAVKCSEIYDIVESVFEVPTSIKANKEILKEYVNHLLTGIKLYLIMVSEGVPFEDVRYVLSQAIKSRILVGMNARELVTSFLPLRMCAKAQKEIREVAWKLWGKLQQIHPQLFKYVGPRCILIENTLRNNPAPLESYLSGKAEVEVLQRCPELVSRKDIVRCVRNTHDSTFNIRY